MTEIATEFRPALRRGSVPARPRPRRRWQRAVLAGLGILLLSVEVPWLQPIGAAVVAAAARPSPDASSLVGCDKIGTRTDQSPDELKGCYYKTKSVVDYVYMRNRTRLLHHIEDLNDIQDDLDYTPLSAAWQAHRLQAHSSWAELTGYFGSSLRLPSELRSKALLCMLVIGQMDADRRALTSGDDAFFQHQSVTRAAAIDRLLTYAEAGTVAHALVALLNRTTQPVFSRSSVP